MLGDSVAYSAPVLLSMRATFTCGLFANEAEVFLEE